MKKKTFIRTIILLLVFFLFTLFYMTPAVRSYLFSPWHAVSYDNPYDVWLLVNGYKGFSVEKFKVAGTWDGSRYKFDVLYVIGPSTEKWGYKKAYSTTDAQNFLNGGGAYKRHVKDAQITALSKGSYSEFYIFYIPGETGDLQGDWSWAAFSDKRDAADFLNGENPSGANIKDACITSIYHNGQTLFYLFFRTSTALEYPMDWAAVYHNSSEGIADYVMGDDNKRLPVYGFDITSSRMADGSIRYYNFFNRHTLPPKWPEPPKPPDDALHIASPLEGERFVTTEPVTLRFHIPQDFVGTVSPYMFWYSNIDGFLGFGLELELNGLSTGQHRITAYGVPCSQNSVNIRVYEDLQQLFLAEPSPAEYERILGEFYFFWLENDDPAYSWRDYTDYNYEPGSSQPSKAVALAKLDLIRHQHFSKSFPLIEEGSTLLHYIRTKVHTIGFRLNCSPSSGTGSGLNFNRGMSVWYAPPPSCIVSGPQPMNPYIRSLALFVHEAKHAEIEDPGHNKEACDCGSITINPGGGDDSLENGSGYAQAAIYLMWIYKYSITDNDETKWIAKEFAKDILEGRFCSPPTHPNEDIQEIIDEIL